MSNLSDFVGTGSDDGYGHTISWSAPVAVGGETTLSPPYSFNKATVMINGAAQDETRQAFAILNNQIVLSEPLEEGDEVQVILGQTAPPGSSEWNLIMSDFTAEHGQKLWLDSRGGAFTITLPAQPEEGQWITLLDVGEALDSEPITLARNNNLIMGIAEDMTLATPLVSLQLLYSKPAYGWRILE